MARNVHRKLIEKKLVSTALKTYSYYLRCTCGWVRSGPIGTRGKAVERWEEHREGSHADETLLQARKRLLAMQEDKDRCPCDGCKRMFARLMAEQTYLQDLDKQKAAYAEKMAAQVAIENRAAEIHRDAEQARDRVAEIVAKFTQRDVAQG